MHTTYGAMGWHVDPTSEQGRNFRYVEKEGKYFRSWERALSKWALAKLREWQEQVVMGMEEQDDRRVLVVVDPEGGKGKTILSKYLVANHKAEYVPPLDNAQDLMAFAMAKPSTAYIFDLPRIEDIKKMVGMWSAIEQIKNGYLYDKRYNYKDQWIDPPKIVVFSNSDPPLWALSRDRWVVCDIVKMGVVYTLVPRTKQELFG